MDSIVENQDYNIDISFLNIDTRPIIESYFHQRGLGEYFNKSNLSHNSLFYDLELSPFVLINHYLISEFKSASPHSKDSSYVGSYDSLDKLFSVLNINNDFNYDSPFFPGIPTDPNGFKGRIDTLNHILRYFSNVFKGRTQHFYLTGKRRMGKTSIIMFLKDYMNSFDVASVYVSNKGNDSVEFLTKNIIESLLTELTVKDSSLNQRLKDFFQNHLESIEFKGAKISFKVDKLLSLSFKEDFIDHLISILNEFGRDKKALFIIIDDINGLSDSKEFVHWYKKLADTIAVSYSRQLPIYFLLASYPDKFFALTKQEPSFGSIFEYENIDRLSDNEVRYFFISLFKSINMEIDVDALFIMVLLSMGQPLMMQLIGDSIFWQSSNSVISKEEAIRGIIEANNQLGAKQLRDILYMIHKGNYHLILESLIADGKYFFTKADIKKIDIDGLDMDYEFIDEFINKMLDLDSIEVLNYKNSSIFNLKSFNRLNLINSVFNLDDFDFTNDVYTFGGSLTFIYFWIKYLESKIKV